MAETPDRTNFALIGGPNSVKIQGVDVVAATNRDGTWMAAIGGQFATDQTVVLMAFVKEKGIVATPSSPGLLVSTTCPGRSSVSALTWGAELQLVTVDDMDSGLAVSAGQSPVPTSQLTIGYTKTWSETLPKSYTRFHVPDGDATAVLRFVVNGQSSTWSPTTTGNLFFAYDGPSGTKEVDLAAVAAQAVTLFLASFAGCAIPVPATVLQALPPCSS